ncbi:hypothetical protein [Roseibium aestuarii]|uniref:Uncharacterized protein n=1 Tax=Roseibium aestuarii TaxID=2600299 RepID=A0ABW4JYN3_9HYPH|nr:hypothetical protein [Roseibium aestuarii]
MPNPSKLALITATVLIMQTAAEARPLVQSMSCAAATAMVDQAGSIVMDTSPTTFERFVSGQAFCAYELVAEPAFTSTSDLTDCPIGFICQPRNENRSRTQTLQFS